MALSETLIVNLALSRLGRELITSLDADQTNDAVQARVQYEPTRDALLRSHPWRFAVKRQTLSQDTETPTFEWDYQYTLPSDFMRAVELYDTTATYALEGRKLLTNDDAVYLVYVRKVTNPTEFDALFTQALSLALAVRLCMPLTGDKTLQDRIRGEFKEAITEARLVNLRERNTTGRDDMPTWNDSHADSAVIPT